MVLKSILTVVAGVVLFTAPTVAAGYRPGDFFNLDLSKAALSPDPLGPTAHFEQVPVEASAPDRTEVKVRHVERSHVRPSRRIKSIAPHPKLARHSHGNPMNAQARDTRVQVWPCKSGGICNWQRSR